VGHPWGKGFVASSEGGGRAAGGGEEEWRVRASRERGVAEPELEEGAVDEHHQKRIQEGGEKEEEEAGTQRRRYRRRRKEDQRPRVAQVGPRVMQSAGRQHRAQPAAR